MHGQNAIIHDGVMWIHRGVNMLCYVELELSESTMDPRNSTMTQQWIHLSRGVGNFRKNARKTIVANTSMTALMNPSRHRFWGTDDEKHIRAVTLLYWEDFSDCEELMTTIIARTRMLLECSPLTSISDEPTIALALSCSSSNDTNSVSWAGYDCIACDFIPWETLTLLGAVVSVELLKRL